MQCMTLSLADGGLGLGAMWGEQAARTLLGEAGFTSIGTAHLDCNDRATSAPPRAVTVSRDWQGSPVGGTCLPVV